jgi:hypothetical protein
MRMSNPKVEHMRPPPKVLTMPTVTAGQEVVLDHK